MFSSLNSDSEDHSSENSWDNAENNTDIEYYSKNESKDYATKYYYTNNYNNFRNTLFFEPTLYNEENFEKTAFAKDNHLAIECKRLAPISFLNWDGQWLYLTKALTLAETDVVLASLYAARAKVLYRNKFYTFCLADITRALSFRSCPTGLKADLRELEVSAKVDMKDSASSRNNVQYDQPPKINDSCKNQQISCASSCIRIAENKKFGRHIVATEDIEFGEILAVEKPFAFAVSRLRLNRCHHCLELCLSLIPCGGCTQALYCSDNCMEEARDMYHQFECALPEVVDFARRQGFYLPLKIALLLSSENNDNSNLKLKPGEVYRSDRYKEVHNLAANLKTTAKSELLSFSLFVAHVSKFIKDHTDYFLNNKASLTENRFREILMRQLQVFNINGVHITAESNNGVNSIADGLYSLYSLFNHSCNPNVEHYFHGTTMVLRCISPIKKGEQCFVSYHYGSKNRSKDGFHTLLLEKYHFTCTCQESIDDIRFSERISLFNKFANERQMILCGDQETAKKMLRTFQQRLRTAEIENDTKTCKVFRKMIRECFTALGNWERA